MTYPQAVIL